MRRKCNRSASNRRYYYKNREDILEAKKIKYDSAKINKIVLEKSLDKC